MAERRSKLKAVLVAVLVVAGLAVAFLALGTVRGEEFSPDAVSRRSFWYLEIPLLGRRITDVYRTDSTGPFLRLLQSQSYVTTVPEKQAHWHTVRVSRLTETETGDAELLLQVFDAGHGNGFGWYAWTQQNPPLAKVLWTEVLQLACEQQYVFVPPLLVAAREASSADQLAAFCRQEVARRYRAAAQSQRDMKQFDRAVESFSRALARDPDDRGALLGRAECYDQLGETDKAAADRRAAARGA